MKKKILLFTLRFLKFWAISIFRVAFVFFTFLEKSFLNLYYLFIFLKDFFYAKGLSVKDFFIHTEEKIRSEK